ncbi:MAG: hypothetical protein KA250_13900 [Verrucomicrobiales bacterium]|nr:hypothetical protein [Verrucomicrobiales bacterium]
MIQHSTLFAVSFFALHRRMISDRLLIHGIAITALTLGAVAAFVVLAGMMPLIITITEMPKP